MSNAVEEYASRLDAPISPNDEAIITPAPAHSDLTRPAVGQEERIELSPRDSLRVLDLLENPPVPNAKLLSAARMLPRE